MDDEPDIISTMKNGLERLGYDVDAFTDPRKALDNFKPNYYRRMLLDIRMPQMNGFELTRQIWAIDSNAQVCFLTAFEIHRDEARKVFSNLKSYCFIKKPLLASAIARHLETHVIER